MDINKWLDSYARLPVLSCACFVVCFVAVMAGLIITGHELAEKQKECEFLRGENAALRSLIR